ncbi:unnamed protein product [Amoebophrya sp. A25]|nr:unnamed protein product [Amoebophrya sp. A25]|eukprot:GSA25T00011465001.1
MDISSWVQELGCKVPHEMQLSIASKMSTHVKPPLHALFAKQKRGSKIRGAENPIRSLSRLGSPIDVRNSRWQSFSSSSAVVEPVTSIEPERRPQQPDPARAALPTQHAATSSTRRLSTHERETETAVVTGERQDAGQSIAQSKKIEADIAKYILASHGRAVDVEVINKDHSSQKSPTSDGAETSITSRSENDEPISSRKAIERERNAAVDLAHSSGIPGVAQRPKRSKQERLARQAQAQAARDSAKADFARAQTLYYVKNAASGLVSFATGYGMLRFLEHGGIITSEHSPANEPTQD